MSPSPTRFGAFEVMEVMGHGAMGQVFRCRVDGEPDREVAVKVLIGSRSPRRSERFRREAEALARLDHPNVQRFRELVDHEGRWLLVTEVVSGTPLWSHIRQPPVALAVARSIAAQLADALVATAAAGIRHRDVHPGNVRLTPEGRAVLLDFGIADLTDCSRLTLSGELGPGTPRYAPPEWFEGQGDETVDAYALGVVLYELVRGGLAWDRLDVGALRKAKRAPLVVDSGDSTVDAVVLGATQPDPTQRWSIARIADALAPFRAPVIPQAPTGTVALSMQQAVRSEPTLDFDAAEAEVGSSSASQVGRYTVEGELGRGGMGVVYAAYDPELDRRVALKVLLGGGHATPAAQTRFIREARAVARIEHPAVLPVWDIGRHEGLVFFAMPRIDGGTLADRMQDGRLDHREGARLIEQIARGVHAAHELGLVHRDVKPANILLDDGQPKLTDFGLVVDTGSNTRFTREGQVIGTPAYMAPEQAEGRHDDVGPHTDVYALGVVLYEVLTGERPFTGSTPMAIVQEVLVAAPPLPRTHDASVPAELERICLRAMAREPERRFGSARELADDLARWSGGLAVSAAAPAVGERASAYARRHRSRLVSVSVAAAAVGVTAAALIGWQLWSTQAAQWRSESLVGQRWTAAERRITSLLAEGSEEEARASFEAFATLPEHRGTRTLARAWLQEAQRRLAQDPQDLGALASAYLESAHKEDQAAALSAFAEHAYANRHWDRLRAVVALQTGAGFDAETVHRTAARTTSGAFSEASADIGGRSQDVLSRLGQVTSTERVIDRLEPLMFDGQEAAMMWSQESAIEIVALDGSMQTLATYDLDVEFHLLPGTYWPWRPSSESPLFVVGRIDFKELGVWEIGDDARLVSRRNARTLFEVETGDLDRDGVTEAYLAANRNLLRLDWVDGEIVWDEPAPEVRHLNSEIEALRVLDMDGDDRDELVLSASRWGAYDVRVYEPSTGGLLSLRARRRLGLVDDLVPYQGDILAHNHPKVTDRRAFPPDGEGPPRAVYRLRLVDDGLDLTPWDLPRQERGERFHRRQRDQIVVADINGDGIDEVLTRRHRGLVIRIEEEDGPVWFPLGQREILYATDVDGDGDDELFMTEEGRLSILGMGTEALPVEDAGTTQPMVRTGDPVVAAAWERAEALVRLGLIADAASGLERIAALSADPTVAADLLERAGRLWLDLSRAAGLYVDVRDTRSAGRAIRRLRDAHRMDPPRDRALVDAADIARRLFEFELERELLALTSDPPADRLAALDAIEDRPVTSFTFGRSLDPRWRWDAVHGLRIDPRDGGTRVVGLGGSVLGSLEVEWDGGPYAIELNGRAELPDWGGSLAVHLTGTTVLSRFDYDRLYVQVRGGGGVYEYNVACSNGAYFNHPFDDLEPSAPVTMRYDVNPADAQLSCSGGISSSTDQQMVVKRAVEHPPPGRFRLMLLNETTHQGSAGFALDEVVLTGLRPVAVDQQAPRTTMEQARHLYVASRPAEALERLAGLDEPEAGMLRALCHDQLGHPTLAAAALRDADVPAAWRPSLIRAHGDTLGAVMREAWGLDWYASFHGAWSSTFSAHPERADVVHALSHHLASIDAVPLDAFPVGDRGVHLQLLARRAAALARTGEASARGVADRAWALASTMPDPADSAVYSVARTRLITSGGTDAEVEAFVSAVRGLPTQELFMDRAAVDVGLAAYRRSPAWSGMRELDEPEPL